MDSVGFVPLRILDTAILQVGKGTFPAFCIAKVAIWKYYRRRREVFGSNSLGFSPPRPSVHYLPSLDEMPTDSEIRSRRDSWPPTQLLLLRSSSSKEEPETLTKNIDEDPLTYFLTPTPQLRDDDVLDGAMLDFDAGIEDPKHTHDMVRSVSPSSLDGLSKPSSCSHSPELDFDMPTPDNEEDEEQEDYIRFAPGGFSARFLSLPVFAIDGRRPRPRSPLSGYSANNMPASFPGPSSPPRGRLSHPRGRKFSPTRSSSAKGRPGHLWREPSPDVWSIEEETEEDIASVIMSDDEQENGTMQTKTRKRVRFVLPVEAE